MKSAEVFQTIKDSGIVVIFRGTGAEQSLRTVEALSKAGVKAVEITFNTPGAAETISRIAQEFKNELIVGAGTVINPAHAVKAIESGAEFVLAPNMDEEVIATVKKYGKLMVPGAFTATEVLKCYAMGADIVKIFPASSVGPAYIKDLKGPYNHVDLMPVGGVDLNNAKDFIKAGAIGIGVGGSLVKKELLAREDYNGITELAKRFIEEVNKGRA